MTARSWTRPADRHGRFRKMTLRIDRPRLNRNVVQVAEHCRFEVVPPAVRMTTPLSLVHSYSI